MIELLYIKHYGEKKHKRSQAFLKYTNQF